MNKTDKIDFNQIFKNVDKKYRPIPFWSWNEKLSCDETKRQVGIMDEAGIGGYFMHARGGLLTEYMGEEWFDNVRAAIEEGDRRGMHSWAYDENGWPSGFGGGKVNGLGEEYQQKSLHISEAYPGCENEKNTVLVRDGNRYYYEVNEFYIDVLDAHVIRRFIDEIYAEYYRREGNSFDGFFTDEPQIWRGTGYPWSFTLEEQFNKAYGYSLIDSLDALFLPVENHERVRLDYWQLVTRIFSESFFKQIYDWCVEHGYGFTGHLVLEEDMLAQLVSNGAAMPHYEYFTMPGMDWLCRPVFDCLTPMQVSSAAAQTGKGQILSETFALAGHNVSHGELKRIFEWQMVHGITMLCTHLEGYSLRGIRKRDYPPAMYYQQPWWEDMNLFFDAMSRIGMILSDGKVVADTLLIHPQTTAWILYDGVERESGAEASIKEYNDALLADMRTLEDKHVLYHLGDETLMARHGRVENGQLIIGNMKYTRVVLPKHIAFLPYTEKLLEDFRAQGGEILSADDVKVNDVCEKNRLTYTMRSFDGYDVHYFVNTDNSEIKAKINVGNLLLDPVSGETSQFSGEHTFAPYESIVLIDTHEPREELSSKRELLPLDLTGIYRVKSATYNSLTLDKCDYSFDGVEIEKSGYVLNIVPRLAEYREPVHLHQTYRFTCDSVPKTVYLATETPEIFDVRLNGKTVDKTDCGYFRDSAIRMLNIAGLIRNGENVLELDSSIIQTEKTYEHLDNSWKFESMRNSLSYDMEVEPIYIVGDFGTKIVGEVTELDRGAYRIYETPVISAAPTEVDGEKIDASGYCEFSGELVLEKTVNLENVNYYAHLNGFGMNSLSIRVNGAGVATRMFPPYDVDLSEYLRSGENTVEIRILNNLRNMMGPHHLKEGEVYNVGPGSFFKESCVFRHPEGADGSCHDLLRQWDENICLVHFGLKKQDTVIKK